MLFPISISRTFTGQVPSWILEYRGARLEFFSFRWSTDLCMSLQYCQVSHITNCDWNESWHIMSSSEKKLPVQPPRDNWVTVGATGGRQLFWNVILLSWIIFYFHLVPCGVSIGLVLRVWHYQALLFKGSWVPGFCRQKGEGSTKKNCFFMNIS